MDQKALRRFQALLDKQKDSLREDFKHRLEVLPEGVHAVGDDWAEPEESLDKEMAVESVQEDLYHRITAALKRIDAGNFGTCLRCGQQIDSERLEAVPYAEYCIECERRQEEAAARR